MLYYCPDCQMLSEGNCPHCGKKMARLRKPVSNDPVLIFVGNYMTTSMIEPLLADNGIPYSKEGMLGAGLAMRTGNFFEKYRIYVPFGIMQYAVRVIASTFGNDKLIMSDLQTLGVDLSLDMPIENQTETEKVIEQYASPDNLDARRALHAKFTIAEIPFYDWELMNMKLVSGMKILDIGCGSGDIWAYAPLPENLDVTLCDMSQGMVDTAKDRLSGIVGTKFTFMAADCQDLPFEDNQFDLVLAAHMLYHVPNIDKALSEIWRVLKPDGRLCATTVSTSNLKEMIDLTFANGISMSHAPSNFNRENGEDVIGGHFALVKRVDHESTLQITDAQSLVDYVKSYDTFTGKNTDEQYANLKSAVQKSIDEDGSFDVTKLACMFICEK